MSFAALQAKSEAKQAAPSRIAGVSVAASRDSYEVEARSVAETVSRGGSVCGWSLSRLGDGVQREAAENPKGKGTGQGGKSALGKGWALLYGRREGHASKAHTQHPLLSSPGMALDHETRLVMEERLGADLSSVRVHTDTAAAQSAAGMHANAYTIGTHMAFARGKYAPNSAEGRKLLAHELTHVLQQTPSLALAPSQLHQAPHQIQREEDEKAPSILTDWKGWLQAKARKLPGYDLFCTLIGKDLITDAKKDDSKEAVLHEVLKLVPGGQEAYDRVVASGALEKAYRWVMDRLNALELTMAYFEGLVKQAFNAVKDNLTDSIGAHIERLRGIFKPAFDKVWTFAKEAFQKLFEIGVQVVLDRMGPFGQRVMEFLRKAQSTFWTIVHDPIKFIGHLVDAIKLGFQHFADNIVTHLKDALMDFLFGELGAKIKGPIQFSIGGIFNLILDVLDLRYDAFRAKLVEKTSPELVSFLEGSFDFIMKIASAKSLAGAWEIFKRQAGELIDTLVNMAIDAIKDWVVTKVVQVALVKIVQLFNPASAIVAAIEAIYHTVVTLIEKGKQLLSVLEAVVNSVAMIAEGNIGQAADWVEKSMGKAFNFILAFFAEQAGLGGIGKTIREIITKIKDKVQGVIDKVIDWVIGKTKSLYEKGKATAGKVVEWWQQRKDLLIGDERHAIYLEGSEEKPELMIASTPQNWANYMKKLEPKLKTQKQKDLLKEVVKDLKVLEKPFNREKSASETSEQVQKKRAVFDRLCANIVALGIPKESPPVPVITFSDKLAPGDGGTQATASILSSLVKAGSQPSDKAPIWENLGSLTMKKNYVQGHLLNHNVGGPGLRYNLTPINKRANAKHHSQVERDVKRKVLTEKQVIFYEVKAVYGKHPAKPKPMVKLEEALANGGAATSPQQLKAREKKEEKLREYQAEQTLATAFEWQTHDLQMNDKNVWEKVPGTEKGDTVPNEIDLDV